MTNYTKLTDFASKDALASGNAAKVVKGTEINNEFVAISTAIGSKANTASPALTGTPTSTTPSANDDSTKIATTAYTQAELADLVTYSNSIHYNSGYLSLKSTTVTAGSYGSATLVPAITVDGQGRITAASTNAIDLSSKMYTFAVSADVGTTRDVYLTAGTWQIIVTDTIADQTLGELDYQFTATRDVTVNSSTFTTSMTLRRSGGAGFGRNEFGLDIQTGTTVVAEAGTFTVTIGDQTTSGSFVAGSQALEGFLSNGCSVILERISD